MKLLIFAFVMLIFAGIIAMAAKPRYSQEIGQCRGGMLYVRTPCPEPSAAVCWRSCLTERMEGE